MLKQTYTTLLNIMWGSYDNSSIWNDIQKKYVNKLSLKEAVILFDSIKRDDYFGDNELNLNDLRHILKRQSEIKLNKETKPYNIFEHIDEGTKY